MCFDDHAAATEVEVTLDDGVAERAGALQYNVSGIL